MTGPDTPPATDARKILVIDAVNLDPLQLMSEEEASTFHFVCPPNAEGMFPAKCSVDILPDPFEHSGALELALSKLVGSGIRTDAILCPHEVLLVRIAEMCAAAGINDMTAESAMVFRDKVVMKEHARAAGIACPDFFAIDRPGQLLRILAEDPRPFVLKPRAAGGAVGIQKIDAPRQELGDVLHGFFPECSIPYQEQQGLYILENWVDAPVVSINGLMADGNMLHAWPMAYFNSMMGARAGRAVGDYTLTSDDPAAARLVEFADECIAAFPPGRLRPFHLEAFDSPAGPLFCEIAARCGGPPTAQLHAMATGVDLLRSWLGLDRLKEPVVPERVTTSYGQLEIMAQKGTLVRKPDAPPPFDFVSEFQCFLDIGDLGGIGDDAVVLASCHITAPSSLSMPERMALVEHWATESFEFDCDGTQDA